jgi:hypothetical protein
MGLQDVKAQDRPVIKSNLVSSKMVSFFFNGQYYPNTYHFDPVRRDFVISDGFNEAPVNKIGTLLIAIGKNKSENYRYEYKYISKNIDTLSSYFPFSSNKKYYDSIDYIKFKDPIDGYIVVVDTTNSLYDELRYSYVLNRMKEPILYSSNHDSVIRITRRKQNAGTYLSTSIFFYADSTVLTFSEISMKNNITYDINKKFTAKISKREGLNIIKTLKKISFKSEPVDCRPQGGEFLFEYKENSNYYMLFRDSNLSCMTCKKTEKYFVSLSHDLYILACKYSPNKKDKYSSYN